MILSERLKSETSSLHRLAERHPMQRALMNGRLSIKRYRLFLEQLKFFHAGIDVAWRTLPGSIRGLFDRPSHLRHALLHDLKVMGSSEEHVTIGAAAGRFLSGLGGSRTAAMNTIGARYVFEGACNGGVFIERAMRKSYGERCPPTLHLNPYGESQAIQWQSFRAALDSLSLETDEGDSVIEGAKLAFQCFILLMEDMDHISDVSERINSGELGDGHGI